MKKKGFEDMAWLFTCDRENRGTIRMNFDEAALLWKAIQAVQGDVLELGRALGGSTYLIACAAGEGRTVVSVDIRDRLSENMREKLDRLSVEVLVQDSAETVREPVAMTSFFGAILFDGDHRYEAVKRDIQTHWPALARTGYGIFHDAVANHESTGDGEVTRAIKELLLDTNVATPVAAGGSLWVLQKDKELDT